MILMLNRDTPATVLSESWTEFFRIYNDQLRRYAYSRGLRDADLDDCLQEVWTAVAQKLSDFQRPDDSPGLRKWLYRLVLSKATDIVRQRMRRPAAPLASAGDLADDDQSDKLADEDEARWQKQMLQTMLDELRNQVSEANYRVLQLRVIERREISEVAKELDMSEEQVRYRCYRTLKKLRSMMVAYTGEETKL